MHTEMNPNHCNNGLERIAATSANRRRTSMVAGFALWLLVALPANAQTSYTFTSGPGGDGFNWPASPTGLLDSSSFFTPDSVDFLNEIGNNLFFDSQYQVAGNAPGISNDAMWGNPTSSGFGSLNIDLFISGTQNISFDFAWSVGGAPGNTPTSFFVFVSDMEGRETEVEAFLDTTFTGLGGFDGFAGRISLDTMDLQDDFFAFDGGPFIDIVSVQIDINDIVPFGGPASEFAIDNFDLDGGGSGGGEVFPSVNNGAADVTGSIVSRTSLRGIGTVTAGIEVTNGTAVNTNYSTQLEPGGGLSDAGQVNNAFIPAGQSIFAPGIVMLDRSLPSATYDGDIRVINDGDPSDPDNITTIRIRLAEAPLLTAPSPVDVSAGDKVRLINAVAPANGHRASVEVTGSNTTGPFAVSGYDVDTPAKPGEFIEGDATFDRFGLLSDAYNGTFTASLQMTMFVGVNNEFESFLADAEPVPDEQWTLNATLTDTPADSASYDSLTPLGPGLVGVNSVTTAATIVGGSTASTGSVSMTQGPAPSGSITDIIREGADASFTTATPVYAIQMTYRDQDICPAVTESNLRVLYFNSGASDWQLAVNGNSGGVATFFSGSFEAFEATLSGSPLSTALGTHGVDIANNYAWAIVDHEATFGTGEVGQSCGLHGDLDSDGDVDADDYAMWENCADGPGVSAMPGCEKADCDGDGDVDLADFAPFARGFGL
ncbi:MAG: hypothetical protein GXP29_13280 [Planctomycetes bacterium]|nr:hypothetical protein [Planctomycetota bacterium]